MNRIRVLIGAILSVMLTLGYLASQYAAISGQTVEYAARIDQPQIVILSLIAFLTAIGFFLLPLEKEESP
jgi:hypothetical protein